MFYNLTHDKNNLLNRLSVFIALAPVAKMTNATTGLFTFAKTSYDAVSFLAEKLGIYEFATSKEFLSKAQVTMCETLPIICRGMFDVASNNGNDA